MNFVFPRRFSFPVKPENVVSLMFPKTTETDNFYFDFDVVKFFAAAVVTVKIFLVRVAVDENQRVISMLRVPSV